LRRSRPREYEREGKKRKRTEKGEGTIKTEGKGVVKVGTADGTAVQK